MKDGGDVETSVAHEAPLLSAAVNVGWQAPLHAANQQLSLIGAVATVLQHGHWTGETETQGMYDVEGGVDRAEKACADGDGVAGTEGDDCEWGEVGEIKGVCVGVLEKAV